MAGEIIVTVGLTYKNPTTTGALGSLVVPSKQVSITQNTAAPSRVGGTQIIGFAAHEALDITGLTTLGVALFTNLDDENFVEIGVDVDGTFYPLIRLNFGESFAFRFSQGIAPYAQADTADVIMGREILDD